LQEAAEIVQITWIKFLQVHPIFTGANTAEQCGAWLITVARHEAADRKRDRNRHPCRPLGTLPIEPIDAGTDRSTAELAAYAEREARRRQARSVCPRLEGLEGRVVPAVDTFIGPAGGAWTVAAFWDLGHVPVSEDTAVIGGGNYCSLNSTTEQTVAGAPTCRATPARWISRPLVLACPPA